ncbi:hypothetical protein [Ciceribacter thiooxidans]|uniref:Uncharacterized protein n=1 Tax=Ciceribacter thiooxidans TaxID=1969821 RepID=A0ABV7I8M4_9HYPH|nr:hypothetical protein [Ciceribacter thiooxidans]
MRPLFLAIPLVALATSAFALPKYTSTKMTCAQVQETVRARGTVILTYPSPRLRGHMLYNTYVSSRQFCKPNEITKRVSVPSRDLRYCPVLTCTQDRREPQRQEQRDQQPTDPGGIF